jgi:L-threonylcarbamoyladenylate synthase
MEFLPVSAESLEKAANILRCGGIVAFPTETVYGLGADAFNPEALTKIFVVKERPYFDPLIIHIAAVETLEKTANLSLLSEKTRKTLFTLAENLWPGPLSVVLPKNEAIPGIATAGLSTAAIRFPDNEAAQKLISLSTGALAAPSANLFGSLSPTRAEHVRDTLGKKVDMILDGGQTRIGLESTVIDLTGESIKILRLGGTPKEAIEKLAGNVEYGPFAADSPVSPGQLESHYAPNTPLVTYPYEKFTEQPYIAQDSAFLFFDGSTRDAWLARQRKKPAAKTVIRVLSEKGDDKEAAFHLFETLHDIDSLSEETHISMVFAQLAPPQGLGQAINDRLIRASAPRTAQA